MLAELAQLQHPFTRWWFALGCARVALFPPRKGGLLQTIMKHTIKSIITDLRSAALISFVLVLPFAILEFMFNTVNSRNGRDYIALFGLLWLLPMAFIIILVPVVRDVRAGNNIMVNSISLLFREACLALIAMMWGGILIDQLPCFLGLPNCD